MLHRLGVRQPWRPADQRYPLAHHSSELWSTALLSVAEHSQVQAGPHLTAIFPGESIHFLLSVFIMAWHWLHGATAPAAGNTGLLDSPPGTLVQVPLGPLTQSGTTCLSRPLLKAQVCLSQGLMACH